MAKKRAAKKDQAANLGFEAKLWLAAVHRELTDADIQRLADTYHSWQGNPLFSPRPLGGEGQGEGVMDYGDIAGFCKSATHSEITEHGHVLTPGRYVGAEEPEDDDEPFGDKMRRLVDELSGQFSESKQLEKSIKANLKSLGFELSKWSGK